MDMRNTDRVDDLPVIETPEDVAVLYSWANLHGAKYRDFSASRREYRAQLRHRAAEQVRESELLAQQEAEVAAENAEAIAREAEHISRERPQYAPESAHLEALRQAEEAARFASAERLEAARRSEAAALAEAIARKEEREIAEAHASARRQSARYAESERHRRQLEAAVPPSPIPGQISDPYTPLPQQAALLTAPLPGPTPIPAVHLQPVHMVPDPPGPPRNADLRSRLRSDSRPGSRPDLSRQPQPDSQSFDAASPYESHYAPASDDRFSPMSSFADADDLLPSPPASFRPRGYLPDDASGVRRILRGPEFDGANQPGYDRPRPQQPPSLARPALPGLRPDRLEAIRPKADPERREGSDSDRKAAQTSPAAISAERRPEQPYATHTSGNRHAAVGPDRGAPTPSRSRHVVPPQYGAGLSPFSQQPIASALPSSSRPVSHGAAVSQPRDRRELPTLQPKPAASHEGRRDDPQADTRLRPADTPTPAGPAWLYESGEHRAASPDPSLSQKSPQISPGDTLQQSRERVASRWFALKGVFEQPGTSRVEPAPVRQKETRTPVLAVFSLAGGVGKTSLVATLGRSLSSLGEKVLLTDTTTHGLLPFYFGASELRQGAVRTFSPPSGSTDASIYLVSYDADARKNDETAEETLAEDINVSARGTHRVLLDLSAASSWVVRRLARSNPTILVPVAPDMNSVISLQTVARLLSDVTAADGQPAQIFYLLNHFDDSLPLHLDVREVLRRQLGDRLLPFVIRRAPVVSEALAEGMTVVDYAPDAAVAEDYLHVAHWLRTLAAPATAGFRNVRWSER